MNEKRGEKRSYAKMLRSGKSLPPSPPPSPIPESPMKQYSFDRPFPQQFSLPRPTVLYMIERHKSLGLHEIFMKLCKFTYAKNRVVPVSQPTLVQLKTKPNYWKGCFQGNRKRPGKINNMDNGNFKLWIISHDSFDPFRDLALTLPGAASTIASKTYRCDANVNIQKQVMSFSDFKILTGGTNNHIKLSDNVIKYSDGSIVPFECILENLLHVSSLHYEFSPSENDSSLRTSQNIKNIMDVLARPNKIHKFHISGLTESFDIALFAPFLLKTKSMNVILIFQGKPSDPFQKKLKNVIRQILEAFLPRQSGVSGCPFIEYDGISEESVRKIQRVRRGLITCGTGMRYRSRYY